MTDEKDLNEINPNSEDNIENDSNIEKIKEESNNEILESKEDISEINSLDIDENAPEEEEKEKLSRKEKRIKKLRNRYFEKEDIKYRGPLSYRYLRVVAWVSIAIAQYLTMNAIATSYLSAPLVSGVWEIILNIFSELSIPLFFIAAFATILNKSKTYKSVIILYAVLYSVIGVAVLIVFRRYLVGIFNIISEDGASGSEAAGALLGKRFQINVFGDLLMLSLFNFFIAYMPKKKFQGKKIYLFRSFALIPLIVVTTSYILKVNSNLGNITLPFELYPFLTTKPPLVYVIFITITLWMKRRERLYIKVGGTYEGYNKYMQSNRFSLYFSITVSVILVIASIVDLIFGIFVLLPYVYEGGTDLNGYLNLFEIGKCASLFFAIPFVLLFSFTRTHKESKPDLLIPLAGIGLIILAYVEAIYEIATMILSTSA